MVNNLQRALILEVLPVTVEADDPDDAFLLAMALVSDADLVRIRKTPTKLTYLVLFLTEIFFIRFTKLRLDVNNTITKIEKPGSRNQWFRFNIVCNIKFSC